MFIRKGNQGIYGLRGDFMSVLRKPIEISRSERNNRDVTIQLFNLNILSHNQGPAFAELLKLAVLTAFAYAVSKFVNGESLFKNKG